MATKWPPLDPGTKVQTSKPNKDLKEEWTEEGWVKRRWGVKGKILTHHDSHGLCYDVTHPDGTVGCYDRSEFDVLSDRGAFTELLRVALDESNLWNRAEWAEILNTQETVIESWIGEHGIPTPEELRSIGRTIHETDNVPQWILDRWKDEEHRPWRGVRLIPENTMRQYMARPILEGFLRTLRCLPGDLQEEVLYKAADLAREELSE